MSNASPPTVGRVIRAALIILPFGTIVLGALSFVFYFNQKEKVAQRSIKYAAGLRKDLNESDLQRYEQIVAESQSKPQPERAKMLASFLESTLGPENMGYEVRRVVDRSDPQAAPLALDVEVTGSKRARDVVLVLVDYLADDAARPLACALGIAHADAGQARVRSLRLATLKGIASLAAYHEEATSAQDRITHLVLLGATAKATDAELMQTLHLEGRGVVILRPELQGNVLPAAQTLHTTVNDLADRL
jgi:hypothetical protein